MYRCTYCPEDIRNDLVDLTSLPTILHIYQGDSFYANITIKRPSSDIKYVCLTSSALSSNLVLKYVEDVNTNKSVWAIIMDSSMTWAIEQGSHVFKILCRLNNNLEILLYQGIMQVAPGSYTGEKGIDASLIQHGVLNPAVLPDNLIISKSKYIYITRNEQGQFIVNMSTSPIPEEIIIETFTNNVILAEIGSTVINLTFNWTLNKTPKMLLLENINLNTMSTSYTWEDINLTENRVFTLYASDEDETTEATTAVTFVSAIYYGVSNLTGDSINSDFVNSLTKLLDDSKKLTFQVNAEVGEYIYFACPANLGTPRFYVSGFEGGFILENGNVQVTNAFGRVETYQVWRSSNPNLGNTFVDVR